MVSFWTLYKQYNNEKFAELKTYFNNILMKAGHISLQNEGRKKEIMLHEEKEALCMFALWNFNFH